MRVTMLGISGSGKTTYMAGLAQQMFENTVGDGYTISPSADDLGDGAVDKSNFSRLLLANNDFNFPAGTTGTTNWEFNLCKGGTDVCFFEWIDFRGGYIDQLSDGIDSASKTEVSGLLTYIEASDAVIVFIDAIRAFRYRKNKQEARHHTKAAGMFHLLRHIAQNNSERTFIVVGTKADSDLIDQSLQKNNFAGLNELLSELFSDLYSPLLDAGWKGAIASVGAVGVGKVSSKMPETDFREVPTISTQIIGFPEPINVETPLLYCLLQELRKHTSRGGNRVANDEKELIRVKAEVNLITDIFMKIAEGKSLSQRIKEWSTKLENEKAVLARFSNSIPELEKIVREKIKVLSP